ncbi:MAG: hypothetical protein JHC31_07290 [Sulfurihydrogenibium sp.]|nr:hypothetical protein [Sulfurihydrogenibium sp.]
MKRTNKSATIYITQIVYRFYHETSARDLCLVLYPSTKSELEKIESINRSEVTYIQIRMPQWWISWYYGLSLENRFKFAKVVEQRLKEYKLI